MKASILFVSPRSVCFEIDSGRPFRDQMDWEVRLDDQLVREDAANVQSLYNLRPNTAYTLRLAQQEETIALSFRTPPEAWTLDVRAFGAAGDGLADDTQALQAAIYACPPDGRVLVPAGTYLFTSLYFKSHVRFEIQKGATLVAKPGRAGRAILPGFVRDFSGGKLHLGSWEGNPLDCYAGLFTLLDVEDVLIYGEGVLEGSGSVDGWWQEPKRKEGAWRPRAIFMRRCANITIQGITVRNSPSWTIHPLESKSLAFYNVQLKNPWDSPNTDGIDPESCADVQIIGCHFSLGDDCIALKSGKISMARELGIPTERIRIRNCYMEDGHGAVTLGSEMASGIRDVEVSLCVFARTDRGLRIKTRRGRGSLAVIEDIVFRDIEMQGVLTPFVVNMFYFCDPDGHSHYVQQKTPADGPASALPRIGSLHFEGIKAKDCGLCGLFAYGLPEQPIEAITLRDVELHFASPEDRADGTKPAMLDDDDWHPGDLLYAKNVRDLLCDNVRFYFAGSDRSVLAAIETLRISENSCLPE